MESVINVTIDYWKLFNFALLHIYKLTHANTVYTHLYNVYIIVIIFISYYYYYYYID